RFIPGTSGDDLLQGGDGDDTLAAPLGNNWLLGGDGDDLLVTNLGSDRLDGGNGDDLMAAGEDNDLLLGGAGNDVLLGNAGDDWIAGNDGDDLLFGGAGRDRLRGGDGNDIFVLVPEQGRDIILDFELGRDRILLAGGLTVSDLELRGNTIRSQGETLAVLDRVFNLIAVDFI
ncbi:MAG: calcium-binding protein, partial [Cyanobacteria bacterium P01_H01_bin.130]